MKCFSLVRVKTDFKVIVLKSWVQIMFVSCNSTYKILLSLKKHPGGKNFQSWADK